MLSHLPLSPTDPWTSLLVTGTLAIINPEDAYSRHGHGHGSMGMVWKTHQGKVLILDQDWDTTEIQPEIYDYILYTVLL